jgi:hypothetical protein
MLAMKYPQASTTLKGKNSANENKVFVMTVTKPSLKLGKSGRGASFA